MSRSSAVVAVVAVVAVAFAFVFDFNRFLTRGAHPVHQNSIHAGYFSEGGARFVITS